MQQAEKDVRANVSKLLPKAKVTRPLLEFQGLQLAPSGNWSKWKEMARNSAQQVPTKN